MRTIEQIAADLIAAQREVEFHFLRNTTGKSSSELIEMRAAWARAQQRLWELQDEERNWIEMKQ